MIKPLTSLRFFFALMIFFHHIVVFNSVSNGIFKRIYYSVFNEFFIGVNFFFILSGFILTHVYIDKFSQKSIKIKDFYIARMARIYPLHVLTLIAAIPLSLNLGAFYHYSLIPMFISNLILTQSYIPIKEYYFSFNIVSWSVSDEMFFYLLFPFLINTIIKTKKVKLIHIFSFCLLALAMFMYFVNSSDLRHAYFYIHPFFRLMDFAIGIVLYFVKDTLNIKKFKNTTRIEISSIILFALFFILHSFVPKVLRYSVYYWIPLSLLILVFYYQSGFISKLLSNHRLVFLGEMSYSFYLVHFLVIKYVSVANKKFNFIDGLPSLALTITACLIISTIISYLLFKFIEIPFKSYIINHSYGANSLNHSNLSRA